MPELAFDVEGPPKMSHEAVEEAVQALLCETCHTMVYHSFELIREKRIEEVFREEMSGVGSSRNAEHEDEHEDEQVGEPANSKSAPAERRVLSLEDVILELRHICHPHLAPGMYLRKTDIVSDGIQDRFGRDFLRLVRQKEAGRCQTECATLTAACEILRDDLVSMSELANALWEGQEGPDSILARQCGGACSFYEPGALPEGYVYEDVPFVPLAIEDLSMDIMQALYQYGSINWEEDGEAGRGRAEKSLDNRTLPSLSDLDHVEDLDEVPEEYRLSLADMDLLREFQDTHNGADHVDLERGEVRELIARGSLPDGISFLIDNTVDDQEMIHIDLSFLKDAEEIGFPSTANIDNEVFSGNDGAGGASGLSNVAANGEQCESDGAIADDERESAYEPESGGSGSDEEFTLSQADIDMLRDLRSEHGLADRITLPSEEVASLVAQGRLPAAFTPPPGMKAAAEISIDLSIVSHFDNADMTFGELGSLAPPGIASGSPLGEVDW